MSINPIMYVEKIWIRGKLKNGQDWFYIGNPLEVHPDKIIFKSSKELVTPIILQIGVATTTFKEELRLISYSAEKNEYFYQLEFSSYYQCLTFMFSWCKSLKEKELVLALNSRKFTHFFNIEDLAYLLGQINNIKINEAEWKAFVKVFVSHWKLSGLELVDSVYDSKVFSQKKENCGLPDFSIPVDQYGRYKLKAWGEVGTEINNEMNIICYFLDFLLSASLTEKSDDFHIRDNSSREDESRAFKLIGISESMNEIRKSIGYHKNNDINLWLSGPFGSGKTLLAKTVSEELVSTSKKEMYFLFSPYNQKIILEELESFCADGEDEKVIILDKMDLLDESLEIKVWKLVKAHKNFKFIFVSINKSPDFFDGDNLEISALKDRAEDIPLLTEFLLAENCHIKNIPTKKIADVFLKKFKVYKWPGNISELNNFLKCLIEYHYFDNFIDYRNEDFHHQCDPYQKQLYRLEEIKKSSEFSGAYWKERILKVS